MIVGERRLSLVAPTGRRYGCCAKNCRTGPMPCATKSSSPARSRAAASAHRSGVRLANAARTWPGRPHDVPGIRHTCSVGGGGQGRGMGPPRAVAGPGAWPFSLQSPHWPQPQHNRAPTARSHNSITAGSRQSHLVLLDQPLHHRHIVLAACTPGFSGRECGYEQVRRLAAHAGTRAALHGAAPPPHTQDSPTPAPLGRRAKR